MMSLLSMTPRPMLSKWPLRPRYVNSGTSAEGSTMVTNGWPMIKSTKVNTTPNMKATIWFSVSEETHSPIAK